MRGHRRSSDKARGPQSVGWLLTARCRRGPAVPDPGTEEAEENMSTGWTAPGSTGQPAGHEPGPANGSGGPAPQPTTGRSEEHTSELQSRGHLVCRLLLEKKKSRPD